MEEYQGCKCRYFALASRVLAVAKQGGRGDDWSAYIDAVDGKDHDQEWQKVVTHGTKLFYAYAKVMFPDFDKEYQWRS